MSLIIFCILQLQNQACKNLVESISFLGSYVILALIILVLVRLGAITMGSSQRFSESLVERGDKFEYIYEQFRTGKRYQKGYFVIQTLKFLLFGIVLVSLNDLAML